MPRDPLDTIVRFGTRIGMRWRELVDDPQHHDYLRWVAEHSRKCPKRTREAIRAALAELGEAEAETSALPKARDTT